MQVLDTSHKGSCRVSRKAQSTAQILTSGYSISKDRNNHYTKLLPPDAVLLHLPGASFLFTSA